MKLKIILEIILVTKINFYINLYKFYFLHIYLFKIILNINIYEKQNKLR